MPDRKVSSYPTPSAYLGSQKNGLVVLKKEILQSPKTNDFPFYCNPSTIHHTDW